jgi:uncharacterized protein
VLCKRSAVLLIKALPKAASFTKAVHDAMQREPVTTTPRLGGSKSLPLFGSVVRDEASPTSDVDLLVEFDGRPVGLFHLSRTQQYLERILGVPRVDLVLRAYIKPALRERILREAVDAAWRVGLSGPAREAARLPVLRAPHGSPVGVRTDPPSVPSLVYVVEHPDLAGRRLHRHDEAAASHAEFGLPHLGRDVAARGADARHLERRADGAARGRVHAYAPHMEALVVAASKEVQRAPVLRPPWLVGPREALAQHDPVCT